jgi:hypothetical protein
MRKIKTKYEDAAPIIAKAIGHTPTWSELTGLYHEYAKNWRAYDGLGDFLAYYLDDPQ